MNIDSIFFPGLLICGRMFAYSVRKYIMFYMVVNNYVDSNWEVYYV